MQQKPLPAQQKQLEDNRSMQLRGALVSRSCSQRVAAGLLALQFQMSRPQALTLASSDNRVKLVPKRPAELGAGLRQMQQSSTAQAPL